MQGKTDAPRDDLTADEVVALIECGSLTAKPGLELLDVDDELVTTEGDGGDITSDLVVDSLTIARSNYADIHGTCQFEITRQLEWGSARVKPYVTLRDNLTGAEARFDLGVYLLETPDAAPGEDPVSWVVEGYDKLMALRRPVGRVWTGNAGDSYLTLAEALINEAGETKVLFDPTAADKVLPVDMVRPLDNAITFLSIVNELVTAIGYRGAWVDWDGWYRSGPYVAPSERAPEWTYDATSATTTVEQDRVEVLDLHGVPNKWIFVNTSRDADDVPIEGDGRYTVLNQSNGPTSIDARGGDPKGVRPSVIPVEVVDQDALETYGDRVSAAEQQVAAALKVTIGPNPLTWHADVYTLIDPALPPSPRKVVGVGWSWLVGPAAAVHEWRTVA